MPAMSNKWLPPELPPPEPPLPPLNKSAILLPSPPKSKEDEPSSQPLPPFCFPDSFFGSSPLPALFLLLSSSASLGLFQVILLSPVIPLGPHSLHLRRIRCPRIPSGRNAQT